MKKINLLDYSKSCVVPTSGSVFSSGSRSTDFWKITKISGVSNNFDFEELVIQQIVNQVGYGYSPEYVLLFNFFKQGGKLENTAAFYNNIEGIKNCSHSRGCDLVYTYSKNVLKGRLPKAAEDRFLRDLWESSYGSKSAYKYAKYVVRGRLPEEHEKGCNNLDYIYFLQKKGVEISEVLINSPAMSYYYYRRYYNLPEVVHNFMLAMQLSGDYYANAYFKQRKKDDKLIKGRLQMVDKTKTVEEVLVDL